MALVEAYLCDHLTAKEASGMPHSALVPSESRRLLLLPVDTCKEPLREDTIFTATALER